MTITDTPDDAPAPEVRPWSPDPWDRVEYTDLELTERPRPQRRLVQWVVYSCMLLGVVALIVFGAVGLWYTGQVNPKGDPADAVTFVVSEKDTLQTVSDRLAHEHLVNSAWLFRWYVEHHGGLELTPGYFRLRPRDHMGNLMRVLRTPPSQTFTKLTFPEGFTTAKMAERLAAKVPRLTVAAFEQAVNDGVVRSKYQPVEQNSLEGLLFPDTYQVSNGESESQVVARMVTLFERVAGQEGLEARAKALGVTPYQAIIIASLIEREAKVDTDRPKIARVIYNRLALGMPLQIDAALYYQQDPTLAFDVLRAIDTPYNTYLHKGLPPTPIANPGRLSLRAALNPAANPSKGDPLCRNLPKKTPCELLYYVLADTDGHHAFAVTLAQHEANVEAARKKGLLP